MAQAPAVATAESVEVPPKSSKKFLFIIIAVVVLAIGGGAAYYFLGGKHAEESDQAVAKEKEAKPEVYLPMEVFTVNLNSDIDMQQQFLQVSMTLQMPTDKDVEKIKERMPEVRNRILYVLSTKKASEINTVEGKDRLVKEITDQINLPFYGSEKSQAVTTLFFTSFIIQ